MKLLILKTDTDPSAYRIKEEAEKAGIQVEIKLYYDLAYSSLPCPKIKDSKNTILIARQPFTVIKKEFWYFHPILKIILEKYKFAKVFDKRLPFDCKKKNFVAILWH